MALIPTGNLLAKLLRSVVADMEGNKGDLAAFGFQWILEVVPFVLFPIIPEIPVSLEEKYRSELALKSATQLYTSQSRGDVLDGARKDSGS